MLAFVLRDDQAAIVSMQLFWNTVNTYVSATGQCLLCVFSATAYRLFVGGAKAVWIQRRNSALV